MATQKRTGLGKGLDVFFGSDTPVEIKKKKEGYVLLNWGDIDPDKKQARKVFDEKALEELSLSIKRYGIIEPIIVKENGDRYVIVSGERRWRAANLAGVTEIPAIIKSLSDEETAEISLIENLQREDLNPVEEAMGIQRLMDEFGYTQEAAAASIGRSRSAVANILRLLNLPKKVLDMVSEGTLSSGHARAILALENEDAQISLANEVIEKDLSVRQTEQLVAKLKVKPEAVEAPKKKEVPVFITDLTDKLTEKLQTKVVVDYGEKKGTIKIEYYGDDELDRIYSLLVRK